jgi:diguanylate cyclase (GGDEF)-like protein
MLLTAMLLLNGGVRVSGGVYSALWPGYFVFLAVATFFFSRWWQQSLFFTAVVGLELIQSAGGGAGSLSRLGLGAALLAVFQTVFHLLFLRERQRMQRVAAEYGQLREAAEHFGRREEDRMGPELEAHSSEARMMRLINASEELDAHMGRLLNLARRAVEAQTVTFFEREGNHFVFRGAAEGGPKVDRKVKIRVGEGLIGGAAKMRKAVLMKNLAKGRHRVRYFRDDGKVVSLMSVPVIEEEVVRGLLVADHAEEGQFSRSELEVFEGFAVEVNLLLENSRSSWRDRRSASMETVSAISKALMSSTLNLKEMLETLVVEVKGEVPYDQCAVFLVDPSSRRLILNACKGFLFAENEHVSFPMDDNSLPSYIATHGQPLLFSNVKHLQIVPGYTGIEKMHSFMGFPLKFREELEGVLIFASAQQGKFTSYQKEILDILVNQASAQVSNAILHEQVQRVAITDGLTGLYNHRHFQERLSHELKRSLRQDQRVSLLLLDIDHFKSLNDDYGHPFGDEVLKGISAQLSLLARDIDLVARYGGEEFVVVLGNAGRRDCKRVAERIRKEIEGLSFDFKGKTVKVTVSVGGATFPEDGETKEELIRHADQALYQSKHSGRNRYTAFKNVT